MVSMWWLQRLTWRDRLIAGAPVIAVLGLALVDPADDGISICPFALGTGTACPGCGMTRAASSLVRGELTQAMSLHPLIPIIALQLLVGWGWLVLRRAGKVRPISNRALNWTLIATTLALLAVWAARILTGTLPPV